MRHPFRNPPRATPRSVDQLVNPSELSISLQHRPVHQMLNLPPQIVGIMVQRLIDPEFNADEAIDTLAAMSLSAVYPQSRA